VEVSLVGIGTRFRSQLTPAAVKAMRDSARIFTTISEPPTLWVPHDLDSGIITALQPLYRPDRPRQDNYHEAAAMVLAAARLSPVAYVTYGHPLVFDRVSQLLMDQSTAAGMTCRVYAAPSSVDEVMAVVGQDYAPGLQIYEAYWLVRCRVAPDTKVSTILMQPQAFGTDRVPDRGTLSTAALEPLARYLGGFYPSHHPAIFVRAGIRDDDGGYVGPRTVDTLASGPLTDLLGTSLFIPPVGNPENRTRKWARLYDPELPSRSTGTAEQ